MTRDQMQAVWDGKLKHVGNINIWHSAKKCLPGVDHTQAGDSATRVELDDARRELNELEDKYGELEDKCGELESELNDLQDKVEQYEDRRLHVLRLVKDEIK